DFDPELIVDLHHNLRTRILRTQIGGKWSAFKKLNIEKWLKVNLKLDRLPNQHVVDRYMETLVEFDVLSDGKGLDFFIPAKFNPPSVPKGLENGYVALVIGAKYLTKQLPLEKLVEICDGVGNPVILIGGKEDRLIGSEVETASTNTVYNACGECDLLGSAWFIKKAEMVITHDTGMMHIAAAFKKKVISVWGNTIPQFGMYPYMPDSPNNYFISEVSGLNCRPCSKIGFSKCPKGHFDCMQKQDTAAILQRADQFKKS
ncbi:MAG: glycosyltransferase family 9 protein, partial [Flavobacteriales bacterium]|nr:glycosyltransferase family 9 protein [Flavobacteriales bacterium]